MDKGIKKRQEDKAKEIWTSVPPSAKQCKTCIYAYSDTEFTVGAEKANCDMYQPPHDKPVDVLWHGADCLYHIAK